MGGRFHLRSVGAGRRLHRPAARHTMPDWGRDMSKRQEAGRREAAAARGTRPSGRTSRDEKYEQLSMALEAAGIGLWDWDLGTDRVAMSPNLKTLLGLGAGGEDIPFEALLRVVHPADKGPLEAALNKAIARKGPFDEEFRAGTRDGAVRWMRIRGRVCPGARGIPKRVMGSIHDKTERKMVYDALEEKVKERTRELLGANERLRREIAIKADLQKQMMEVSEKEQRRIGQDLHDSLSQQLGGIAFLGQVLHEKLKRRGLTEAQDMGKLVAHLQNALAHTRELATGLYPALAEGGLAAALNELAVAVGELYAVKVTVRVAPGVDTSDEAIAIHLYRIVQEAVNNAIRHGQAKRIAVRLFRKNGAVVLTVADNGAGFPEKPNRKGIGLNIMEYRASSIGAAFRVESQKGQGAVVTCVFPRPSAFTHLD